MAAQPEEKYRKPSPLGEFKWAQEDFVDFTVLQDKKRIKLANYYQPPQNPQNLKGILVLFHGMNANAINYAHVAVEIAKSDIAVAAFDQRGMGKSEGIKGFIEPLPVHINDCKQYIDLIQQKIGNKIPLFIGGQSFGGATAMKLCVDEPNRYKGVVLLAPAIKNNIYHSAFGKKIARCIGSFLPRIRTVPQSRGQSSKNPQISEDAEKNPYIYTGKVIPGSVKTILDLTDLCYESYEKLTTPFLVIQGGMDKLVDSDLAKELIQRSPSKDQTVFFYEDLWHSVILEEEYPDIVQKIQEWLRERGENISYKFAKNHKCNIILFDIRRDLCQNMIQKIEELGGKGYFYKCDVSDDYQIKTQIQKVLAEFKSIDILINCVGIANMKFFLNQSIDEIQKTYTVNCQGPISVIRQILPSMIEKNKGQIVSVTSMASVLPGVKMTEYCASKSALNMFHQALRMEMLVQQKKIDFTLVCPYILPAIGEWRERMHKIFPSLSEEYQGLAIYQAIMNKEKEIFIPQIWNQLVFILISLPVFVFDQIMLFYTGEFLDKLLGVDKEEVKRKSSISSQCSN
ncbi:hypothetical protein PPERSA_11856 [Pseudocohnilembus persalinus]|uniref:Serine aminopeptidase S33 domain-containing protein n=1 Tax=Pseudocohnilembus persalinus TaxID=266149 RepID=A0A0V0QJX9_PSEPJ|nr:hypothetical protein PPERSA_11856 [Pseudocohnilembus persalinus]|eukprot:KRX02516.1 hypothetical protein PPERSA_11856 [Pseudocohnilembus persalinus]